MATKKTKKTVVVPIQEPLHFSKTYGRNNLTLAKSLFDGFVEKWNTAEKKPSVYRLLNEGFRQLAYIRLKKVPGQKVSDATQMFYAWLQMVDQKVAAEIKQVHKEEQDAYIAEMVGQMFPAREVMFGTCDPELAEVADDSQI